MTISSGGERVRPTLSWPPSSERDLIDGLAVTEPDGDGFVGHLRGHLAKALRRRGFQRLLREKAEQADTSWWRSMTSALVATYPAVIVLWTSITVGLVVARALGLPIWADVGAAVVSFAAITYVLWFTQLRWAARSVVGAVREFGRDLLVPLTGPLLL